MTINASWSQWFHRYPTVCYPFPFQKFLETFGYLPSFDSDDGIRALMSDDSVRSAIKNVQKFGQLAQVIPTSEKYSGFTVQSNRITSHCIYKSFHQHPLSPSQYALHRKPHNPSHHVIKRLTLKGIFWKIWAYYNMSPTRTILKLFIKLSVNLWIGKLQARALKTLWKRYRLIFVWNKDLLW